jgi:hypothetical protein
MAFFCFGSSFLLKMSVAAGAVMVGGGQALSFGSELELVFTFCSCFRTEGG